MKKVLLTGILMGCFVSPVVQASQAVKLNVRVSERTPGVKWVSGSSQARNVHTVLLAATPAVDDVISSLKLYQAYECDAVVGTLTGVPGSAADVQQVYSLSNCN